MLDKNIVGSASKIAIYIPSLMGGGAERVMLTIANAIAEKGITVDLVLVEEKGVFLADVSKRVRVINLNASRVIFSLFPLIRYIRRNKPTVILSALNYANVIAVAAKKLSFVSTKNVVSERTIVSKSFSASFKFKLLLFLMQWAYKKADAIIAISNGVALDLSKRLSIPLELISVVYNPICVDIDKNIDIDPPHEWLKQKNIPILLSIGRLTEAKDYSTLIHAFALLRKKRPCKLIILGEGECRKQLEKLSISLGIQNDIILPGFQKDSISWMIHANIFVLSSAWEGFGNVLVEAMACGVPVISTDCPGGPAEILDYGIWGRIVPVKDYMALAQGIEKTLDEIKHPDVAIRARYFSLERSVNGYLRVLLKS